MNLYDILEQNQETVREVINNIDRYYISYSIRKRSGKPRRIDAPQGLLKDLQDRILYKILYKYKAHPISHGFVKNRSPKTNAKVHVGSKILINLDIRDFFNSIMSTKVEKTLERLFNKKIPYDDVSISDITVLAKLLTYKGRVPQGALTSPAVSNLFMLTLDKNLKKLEKTHNAKITRYCDDISISSNDDKINPKTIIDTVSDLLYEQGLYINKRKTKVKKYYHRMKVTGIIVNEKTNVPREKWRNFRACLHNLQHQGTHLSEKDIQKLRGTISWIESLNPKRGNQFSRQLNQILNTQKNLSTATQT